MRKFRRHNYDKPWRCPGWSGGGWTSLMLHEEHCPGGSFAPHWNKNCWWHFHKCTKCATIAVPHVTRWLDPTYLAWKVRWAWRDGKDELKYQLYRFTHPVSLIQWITRTEWSENWKSWPHCNGQAGCWMHSTNHAWCKCRCLWCRLARRIRRGA